MATQLEKLEELQALAGQDYRVNLDVFEGPLELLLYLIRRDDLDIYDIPIAFILQEYMTYVDSLKELNIDLAGDFLLMAAELTHIKSRMLLPEEKTAEEEEGQDPRADLVRRLLEYQQFREASAYLDQRPQLGRDIFVQQDPERVEASSDGPIETDVFQLMEAFGKLLARVPAKNFHGVGIDRISVNQRIYQLMERISKDVTVALSALLEPPFERHAIVVTFLALLEMCRLKIVKIYQVERCGELYLRGVMEEVAEEDIPHLIKVDDYTSGKNPLDDLKPKAQKTIEEEKKE